MKSGWPWWEMTRDWSTGLTLRAWSKRVPVGVVVEVRTMPGVVALGVWRGVTPRRARRVVQKGRWAG